MLESIQVRLIAYKYIQWLRGFSSRAILIYHRHKPIDSINCWARSGHVMCFLWGTDKPIELSWVLNKRQDDG
jgi:hypothetical protein